MDIQIVDYEQERTVFELCTWINLKLFEFNQEPDFETNYFERKGLNVRKFLQEVIPVAKLGLYLWQPWNEVRVKCLAGNGPYDAEVKIQRPESSESFNVEVTTTETDESTMRRQALSRDGFVYLTGPIRRDGRQIISQAEMEDVDEASRRLVTRAFQGFQRKTDAETDPQTAILVYANAFRSLSASYRSELIDQTRLYMLQAQRSIYGAYYCYFYDNGVDGIRNDRHML